MVYTISMQIGLKVEAGDCPTLNMNAMEIYLLSQSLTDSAHLEPASVLGKGVLGTMGPSVSCPGLFREYDGPIFMPI